MGDPALAHALSVYAESVGLLLRLVQRSIRSSDLIVTDTKNGDSISVAEPPLSVLPSEQDVEAIAQAIGGRPATPLETVCTRAAPGHQVLLALPNPTFASTLFLDRDAGIATVTATTDTPSGSTELMRVVRRTLHSAD